MDANDGLGIITDKSLEVEIFADTNSSLEVANERVEIVSDADKSLELI